MSSERRTVLVVDDSALVCRVVADLIEASADFRVAGIARDGLDAIRKLHSLEPDLVTLDVQMPDLDGLQTLGYIMSEAPRPVIMLSALDSLGGADLTIRALELGAVDFVRKTGPDDALDPRTLRDRLLRALRGARNVNLRAASVLARPLAARKSARPGEKPATHVVAIAASTGGPRALAEILPALPGDLGAAVLVVQHMPAGFTESLARRLDRLASLAVGEAVDGEVPLAGHAYIAPGGRHLTLSRDGGATRLAVGAGAAVRGARPSADLLFDSVAEHLRAAAVGVVLTGMGHDGAAGLKRMRGAGAYALVQDRGTSTVYGMPMTALAHAGADRVVPLSEMAPAILAALEARGMTRRDVTTEDPILS